jgi:hypothetical protein
MPDLITSREHVILKSRRSQLANNLLAFHGGKPYLESRLWRAPNESDRSWDGDASKGITGRRNRAYLVNDAGRVVGKINDYLFSRPTVRNGIDEDFERDVTTTGMSVGQFWSAASEMLTAGQWCWLQPDRGMPVIDPATGAVAPRSIAAKEEGGDRIYWNLWNSTEVVDWCFDATGRLIWLMTEEDRYDNANPFAEAVTSKVRTLWVRGQNGGGCTFTRYFVSKGGEIDYAEKGVISAQEVPFVPLGRPSASPWWFDDVEMIQAAAMNLESLDYENLQQTVYPQLVIPESMVQSTTAALLERYKTNDTDKVASMVREIVRGLEYPFVESGDDNGLTRYLMPPTSDMKILAEKTDKLRRNLFDFAGLAMFTRESKQVASAESKQWDHLDVQATLGNRARLLQEAEEKLIALSVEMDPSFDSYDPQWPDEFSIPNTSEDVKNLVQLGNFVTLPESVQAWLRVTAVELLDQINHIPAEVKERMLADAQLAPAKPTVLEQDEQGGDPVD